LFKTTDKLNKAPSETTVRLYIAIWFKLHSIKFSSFGIWSLGWFTDLRVNALIYSIIRWQY